MLYLSLFAQLWLLPRPFRVSPISPVQTREDLLYLSQSYCPCCSSDQLLFCFSGLDLWECLWHQQVLEVFVFLLMVYLQRTSHILLCCTLPYYWLRATLWPNVVDESRDNTTTSSVQGALRSQSWWVVCGEGRWAACLASALLSVWWVS